MEKKTGKATEIKQRQVKKLTKEDLKKITGGLCRDCTGPPGSCEAYLISTTAP